MSAISSLSDQQIVQFDREMVWDSRWEYIACCINRDFPSGEFTFLDLGCGNGLFTDRVLATYPKAKGTAMDRSEVLLAKHTSNERKITLCYDVDDLEKHTGRYDVVFCNWLLHHLVTTDSYGATQANIRRALTAIRGVFTPRGRLSVFENEYNGYIDSVPSRMIFAISSSKFLAPIVRNTVNTAGVGVSFLSHRAWVQATSACGYTLSRYTVEPPRQARWKLRMIRKAVLAKEVRVAHYWLS